MHKTPINSTRQNPIGIFDSGIGGTSIWKEIHRLLPYENTIYLADSLNAPYGNKNECSITKLSIKNTELLLKKNCKLIVVACNTATTSAISYLRQNYAIPFIGIEPAIKPAALHTKTKAIGILATKGTLSSALFSKTAARFANDVKIIEQVGEGIVELIENGELYSKTMETLLRSYLAPMLAQHIDYLVLGCTHYPYLLPVLTKLLPKHIQIIDSGAAVARQTKAVLNSNHLLNLSDKDPHLEFYTNKNTHIMASFLDAELKVNALQF